MRFRCRGLIVLLIIITIQVSSYAQITFQYKHNTGDKWHLSSRVFEEVFYDGELLRDVEILNKISVEVIKGDGSDGQLYNHYQIAERIAREGAYVWNSDYSVTYGRDRRGRLSGLKKDPPVPAVRNVPVYPEGMVSVFDVWEEKGEEFFDLRHAFNIDEIVVIGFTALYRYEGTAIVDDRDTHKIRIEYAYNWEPEPDSVLLLHLRRYNAYPVAITGESAQIIYWDQEAGKNFAEEGQFSYTFTMSDGGAYTFQGTTQGKAVYAEPMDKKGIAEKIKKLGYGEAIATDEGVKITLDNIHFIPDSSRMLPGEEKKLAAIADILKTIPDKDIQVTGHTASVIPYSDGLELSRRRAGRVAEYLIDTGVRELTQIVIRGMGDREPLADNRTEEGRKKNRRVEIMIMEN
ncbi:MAG: hypothetical protein B0D92_05490 [Spirochaeta sp. LUC14_002_19_P3]|nr:MAG: hypothetical protein B0D92_05490 [Spirochaeta sp. LUC14_002_19_P3]